MRQGRGKHIQALIPFPQEFVKVVDLAERPFLKTHRIDELGKGVMQCEAGLAQSRLPEFRLIQDPGDTQKTKIALGQSDHLAAERHHGILKLEDEERFQRGLDARDG